MFVDKFDAMHIDRECGHRGPARSNVDGMGMGDYYDPESGTIIQSPYDSAAGPGGVVSPTIMTPTPVNVSGTNWAALLNPFSKAASQIAVAQFGQPQLAPGTFIRGADGSILTNQPVTGGVSTLFSGGGFGTFNIGSLLPIIVIGGLVLLVAGGGHR